MRYKKNITEHLLNFIVQFQQKNHTSPSLEDICNEFDWQSKGTARYHIMKLQKNKLIEIEKNKRRFIRVLQREQRTNFPNCWEMWHLEYNENHPCQQCPVMLAKVDYCFSLRRETNSTLCKTKCLECSYFLKKIRIPLQSVLNVEKPVVVIASRIIVMVNNECALLFNKSAEDLIGSPLFNYFCVESISLLLKISNQVRSTSAKQLTICVKRKDLKSNMTATVERVTNLPEAVQITLTHN